jgi:hypothetical protein
MNVEASLIPFLKSLVSGAWLLLLLSGTGTAHPLASPTWSGQPLSVSPPYISFPWQFAPQLRVSSFTIPPEHVSISTLLEHPADFHQRLVTVQGIVTQPELHLDESQLFLNFVFRLADSGQSIVVYGRHDRTQGPPSISLDLSVEVIGVFWKERDLNDSRITNTIEAFAVAPYPPLTPESAQKNSLASPFRIVNRISAGGPQH